MSKQEDVKFETSINRIETIIQEVESGELSMDELNKHVAEAARLLKDCRRFLRTTEDELNKTLSDLDDEEI
jgi:exodeoxyribonuclease VII small subunit